MKIKILMIAIVVIITACNSNLNSQKFNEQDDAIKTLSMDKNMNPIDTIFLNFHTGMDSLKFIHEVKKMVHDDVLKAYDEFQTINYIFSFENGIESAFYFDPTFTDDRLTSIRLEGGDFNNEILTIYKKKYVFEVFKTETIDSTSPAFLDLMYDEHKKSNEHKKMNCSGCNYFYKLFQLKEIGEKNIRFGTSHVSIYFNKEKGIMISEIKSKKDFEKEFHDSQLSILYCSKYSIQEIVNETIESEKEKSDQNPGLNKKEKNSEKKRNSINEI